MFYYPTVLQRHTGCFSTIWLVATKGIRVTRRDYLKVNVTNTCDNIMSYVLEQVPPPRPGLPCPRFSLYLSSQLQYGVVVVFHRQCAIFLEELLSVVGQLAKQISVKSLDLDDSSNQTQLLPDALALMQETQWAQDPQFGLMELQAEASPGAPEQELPETPTRPAETGTTVSPESITLREREPEAAPPPEFEGEELSDHLMDTLDFLMEQMEDTLEREAPQQSPPTVTDVDVEVTPPKEKTREEKEPQTVQMQETTESTPDLPLAAPSPEGITLLPQEEQGLPPEIPGTPDLPTTPVSAPGLPSPPPREPRPPQASPMLEDLAPPEENRQRRGRQLTFFDPETQIPEEELQLQISNPMTETREPLMAGKSLRSMPSAAELLAAPCRVLDGELLREWESAAVITPLAGLNLRLEPREPDTSTDAERERSSEEAERPELSSKEVPRDVAEAEMLEMSGQTLLPLELSDQKESSEISPLQPPEREGSVSRSVSTLPDIPEEPDDLQSTRLSPSLIPEEGAPVPFESLLPPDTDRRTVSRTFHCLLELLSARKLRAWQDEPFGEVWIAPGPESP